MDPSPWVPSTEPSPNHWFGGRVLGDRAFAVRIGKLFEDGNELRMERPNRKCLGDLAATVRDATGIRGGRVARARTHPRGQWRPATVRPQGLIENDLRAVDVARCLGISPAAVTAHLRKQK
jgi:hypothetical protein